jgi:hypothetical protein
MAECPNLAMPYFAVACKYQRMSISHVKIGPVKCAVINAVVQPRNVPVSTNAAGRSASMTRRNKRWRPP